MTADKTAAAIRHVHFEDLGAFEAPIRKAGYGIRYLEAGKDDLSAAKDADLTVFLGGPLGVGDHGVYPFLNREFAVAERRLAGRRPTLGICLGAQVIAHAAGAKVYPGNNGKEIGWKPLTLTDAGRASAVAPLGEGGGHMLHWHGDTFDLPEDAQRLASTDAYANQVYAIGRHVLAFQCHPELNPDAIERWLVGHACEIANTPGTDPVTLREDTARHGSGLLERGRRAIENWLARLPR